MSVAGLGHRDFWPIFAEAERLDSMVAVRATVRGPEKRLDLSEEAKRQILSETARRLYGLSG